MSYSLFLSNPKIYYGIGSIEKVGVIAHSFGERIMLVTGKSSSRKLGFLDTIMNLLLAEGCDAFIYDQIESDPSSSRVEAGRDFAIENNIDCIIALGGGSPIDAAKAISILLTNGGNTKDYEKVSPKKPGIPVIAIPTTAGTGSEVSKYSIITDLDRKIKMLIVGEALLPKAAILDPTLTVSLPPAVTAATGMDALTHAIEAYISKVSQPFTDLLALEAIKLIGGNIIKAITNGEDLETRNNMLLGQMYAGLAFSNASTALVHSMSRPLGVYYGIPHGLANAILLPQVMSFNRSSCPEKLGVIAKALGENTEGKSIREKSYLAVTSIKVLHEETGLPRKLSELGVEKDKLSIMAKDAKESITTLRNPREASLDDIINIYNNIY